MFAGWLGLPNDEFLLPWRSISAEQPGGLDTKATVKLQGWSAPMSSLQTADVVAAQTD
jgi:hypothetical protein